MKNLRTIAGLLIIPGRRRRQRIISHYNANLSANVNAGFEPDREAADEDRVIAERLLRAHGKAVDEERRRDPSTEPDVWSVMAGVQGNFSSVLRNNDPAALATYLCNMAKQDATAGVGQGHIEYAKTRFNPLFREYLARIFKDRLLSLAEAVGAVACENPEQGSWGESFSLDVDYLVDEIEKTLGIDISPPPIEGGQFKIHSRRGRFHERDLHAIFTAWSLRQILDGVADPRLCEIGAGVGKVPYWASRFGMGSYTTIDLPRINVLQGYYLLKTLGADKVALYGEEGLGEKGVVPPRGKACVLPYFMINEIEASNFDLVMNQDSFPELSRDKVLVYLEWMRATATGHFYSINHESRPSAGTGNRQNSVPELVRQTGGFKRLSRVPYWLRNGYVSELYRVNPGT
jgi:hypothetical protein